jgi:transcriptional regulator with XRE-family HTH domain
MAKKSEVVLSESTIAAVREALTRSKKFPANQFDSQIKEFKNQPELTGKNTWIKWFMQGCGLSSQMLADKLGTSRQGVHQLLAREKSGQITIKKMQQIASAADCDFVYAFVPRDNEEMTNKIIKRTAKHLKLEPIATHQGTRNFSAAVTSRLKKFLQRRTGWGIIWGCSSYNKRDYQWWKHDFR